MLIAPKVFKLAKLASKESTRYAITGVCFERQGKDCFAAATDGRSLGYVKWQDEELAKDFPPIEGQADALTPKDGFSTIIEVRDCEAVAKNIPKNRIVGVKPILGHAVLNEVSANGTVAISTTDLRSTKTEKVTPHDGNFPEWRDVIPQYKLGEESASIGVDAIRLAEALKVAAEFTNPEANHGVRLEIPLCAHRPIVIHAKTYEGFESKVVVMPTNDPESGKGPASRLPEIVELMKEAYRYINTEDSGDDKHEPLNRQECDDLAKRIRKVVMEEGGK